MVTLRRHSATSWSWNPVGSWSTKSLEERASGLMTDSWEISYTEFVWLNQIGRFGDEKYCVDKLWVGHNYSHVPEETLSNFAYVCLDVTQSVEEVIHIHGSQSKASEWPKSFGCSWWRTSSTQLEWPSQWLASLSHSFSIFSCHNWGISQVKKPF